MYHFRFFYYVIKLFKFILRINGFTIHFYIHILNYILGYQRRRLNVETLVETAKQRLPKGWGVTSLMLASSTIVILHLNPEEDRLNKVVLEERKGASI